MTKLEATIVFDAVISILKNSHTIVKLVNTYGGDEEKKAYIDGLYTVAGQLTLLLDEESIERCRSRQEQMIRHDKEFFSKFNIEQPAKKKAKP